MIQQITDPDDRGEMLWHRFISRLRINAWGDHTVIQAIAHMLNITITVLGYRANFANGLQTVILPYGVTDGDSNDPDAFNLGFILQCHYMSLHKIESAANISTEESENEEKPSTNQPTTGEALEDKRAFAEACELRGLPYDTCFQNETGEVNQIFSLAPGE